MMKCSAFMACSLDGFIATKNGDVNWLQTAGNFDADLGEDPSMGFDAFLDSVDCLIMGRHTLEKLANFELTEENWPYGDMPIFVVSKTLTDIPETIPKPVEIMQADFMHEIVEQVSAKGMKHAYVDGGQLISGFLNEGLIEEINITRLPILLGEGIPLFSNLKNTMGLELISAKRYANDFIQSHYRLK